MRTGDIFGHVFMWCKMHIFISVLLPRHLRILQERKNLDWKKGTVSFSYFSFSSSKMDDMSAFIAHNAIFILFGLLSLSQAALDSAQLMNAGTEKHTTISNVQRSKPKSISHFVLGPILGPLLILSSWEEENQRFWLAESWSFFSILNFKIENGTQHKVTTTK